MTPHEMMKLAEHLERKLRADGVPSTLIPGILGAAFMASLTNLPPDERKIQIKAHLAGLLKVARQINAAAQAPDGPME